jgi:hypothetical protein
LRSTTSADGAVDAPGGGIVASAIGCSPEAHSFGVSQKDTPAVSTQRGASFHRPDINNHFSHH